MNAVATSRIPPLGVLSHQKRTPVAKSYGKFWLFVRKIIQAYFAIVAFLIAYS